MQDNQTIARLRTKIVEGLEEGRQYFLEETGEKLGSADEIIRALCLGRSMFAVMIPEKIDVSNPEIQLPPIPCLVGADRALWIPNLRRSA